MLFMVFVLGVKYFVGHTSIINYLLVDCLAYNDELLGLTTAHPIR